MKQQLVGYKEVSGKTGVVVVVSSVASLYLISALSELLIKIGVSSLIASIIFYCLAGAVAALVYYRFAIRYIYSADGVKLVIERVYHKKPRLMEQIMLRDILFIGTLEKAEKKYGKIKTHRAVRKTNPNPETAIVFKRAGEKQMLIFQPDEDILKAIGGKKE